MPRWPEGSRRRLIDAAVPVFTERGYTDSTVADIAQRAGLTSRTFFRHFADKEEVLFGDDDELLPILLAAVSDGEGPVRAGDHLRQALFTLAEVLELQRDPLLRRQRIIDSQVSLTGRELAKQANWQRLVTNALIGRGFSAEDGDVIAAIGFALFRRSLHTWLSVGDGTTLHQRIDDAVERAGSILETFSR